MEFLKFYLRTKKVNFKLLKKPEALLKNFRHLSSVSYVPQQNYSTFQDYLRKLKQQQRLFTSNRGPLGRIFFTIPEIHTIIKH